MDNYTFMRMGNLYQATMDVMIAACKRFGAEKAEAGISEIGYGFRQQWSVEKIIDNVEFVDSIKVSSEDIQFVRLILEAEDAIKYAITKLTEAKLIGKEKKKGGVIDVG